jgi:hypothetical protein
MLMHPVPPFVPTASLTAAWMDSVFSAKAVEKGGVVRRSVRDVEQQVGRADFVAEVRRRGFHMVECGGQFVVICNTGHMQVIC